MIRKIRRGHKIVWLILAVLLPLVFIASIAFRHREPVNEKIPELATETRGTQSFQK
jgi:hypothetical protein